MRYKIPTIACIVFVLAAIFWLYFSHRLWKRSDSAIPPRVNLKNGASELSAADQNPVASVFSAATGIIKFNALFATPITFYGRVIDQFGTPVFGATVQCEANDNPLGKPARKMLNTDTNGAFTVHGMHGMALSVEIFKTGYYRIGTRSGKIGSSGGFQYASIGGESVHKPDSGNPTIFVLYKQGEIEPLLHLQSKRVRLPQNGMPLTIQLFSPDGAARRQIQIRAWVNEQNKSASGTFDWKCVIEAIGGEISSRNDAFDFVAPDTGYRKSELIEMPATLSRPMWQEGVERSYFIRFADEVFATTKVEIAAFAGGSVTVSGFLNAKAGSHNLENDPNK